MITPLMSPREYAAIERTLSPSHTMLEWGAGASTLRLAGRVARYFSVEHNAVWWRRLQSQVTKNVTLLLRPGPPKLPLPVPAATWDEIPRSQRTQQYRAYIWAAGEPRCPFDRVLIDGRARVECAASVVPYLADDHLVFFHDFQRARYQVVLERYRVVWRVDKLVALRYNAQAATDSVD